MDKSEITAFSRKCILLIQYVKYPVGSILTKYNSYDHKSINTYAKPYIFF